jgi:hypothetical protein
LDVIRPAIAVCALLLLVSSPAPAEASRDDIHLGQDIRVHEGQSVGTAICFLCSAHIDGEAHGAVVVFAGNVYLKGTAQGDVVDLGGHATLANASRVHGSLVVFGGRLLQDPAALLEGKSVVVPPVVFLPMILFIGPLIAALIFVLRYLFFRSSAAGGPSFRRL